MSAHSGRPLTPGLLVTVLMLSFVTPPTANAVHDVGLFELDGDATANGAPGDDWANLFPTNASSTVFSSAFAHEPPAGDTTYFSVASKDINDVSTWSATGNSAPPKDEILDAFAATYNTSTHGNIVYFGADRWANNGDAAIGFWFLQDDVNITPAGAFTGSHVRNDTLVVSHFTNGGAVATIYVYSWQPSPSGNLALLATGQDCASVGGNDLACAKVNSALTSSPWPYQGSGSKDPANKFPPNSFFEGGVNLTALYGGNAPCFNTFLAETRSSQETTATLKDLVLHKFNNCPVVPPQATITVEKVPLQPVVDLGQPIGFGITVTNSGPDPAQNLTLWDTLPQVSGNWSLGGADAASCGIDIATRNLTCNFGTVGVFESRYIEATAGTAVVADCGWKHNDVFITANGGLSNDMSSADVYVSCSDVSVLKTAAAGAIDLGGNVTFTLTVTSHGPDDAANVTLHDDLPLVAGAWALGGDNATACGLTGATLACDFGTVPVNESRNVTLTAATSGAGDCGWRNNTAHVRARVDTDATNNASSASTYVRCAEVGISKSADGPWVYLGGNVTFAITVTSYGPDPATNVTITDTLPASPSAWEVVPGSDGSCGIAGGVLTCGLGTMPNGTTLTVRVTSDTSDPAECGDVPNTAAVTADLDLDGANNLAAANETVRCSDVSLYKSAAASPVDAGTNVTFTLTVHSDGPDDALGVNLTDALPTNAGPWEIVPGGDASACGIAAGTLSCDFGTVPAGEDRNVTLTAATTSPTSCGWVNNTASVTAWVDTSTTDNSANASVYVTCANVGLEKTASSGATADVGGNVTFTLTVTSEGPDAAENVTIVDDLPPIGIGWSTTDPGCAVANATLTCDLGTLPAGQSVNVSVMGVTTLDDCGPMWNHANATARLDTDPADDAANASLHVTCADVSVLKTDGGDVDVGANATFTITVTSEGPDAAENVTLSDPLPGSVAWTLVATGDHASCGIANGTLACDFGTVNAGDTRTVTVTGPTTIADCGSLDNTATAWARLDVNASNNESTASAYVTCSDVGVAKTAFDATIDVGGNATFTITVTSHGPDAATNVSLDDTLASIGTSWDASSPDGGTCGIAGAALTCDFGTLQPGEQRNLTVTGTTTLADCGWKRNDANVTALVDTDASNDHAYATLYVTCADLKVEKTASAGGSVDLGENVTYAILVTALGPDASQNVTLTDALPPSGTGWGYSPTPECSESNGTLSCDFGAIPAGESRTVLLVSGTGAGTDDCGWWNNTAGVASLLDVNSTNDESTASVYVTCADVTVRKTAGAATAWAGDNATWNVTIESLGPDAAEDVTVADVVANGTVLALTGNASAYCGFTGAVVTCSIPSLAAGASLDLGIVTSTSAADCGIVRNDVTVGARLDVNASNDAANATIEVRCPSNATRTQGFWSAHTAYTRNVFNATWGGTMTVGAGGHTRTIDTDGKLFGAWLSSVPYKTNGHKRAPVDQARMALLQQLVTAKLNCAAFGCNATIQGQVAGADAAYAGNNRGLMATFTGLLDAYNNGGDAEPLPTTYGAWNPATPDASRALADRAFWDDP